MVTNDALIILFLVMLMPLSLVCYMALKARSTKDQQKLERVILEVTKEQPDILGEELSAIVQGQSNHSIHPGRMYGAIDRLVHEGYLQTEIRLGIDLAGERRRLPYLKLTRKGEERLLAA